MALIVFTGPTGNIGRFLGSEFTPLQTRLESSVDEMRAELAALRQPIRSFLHMAAMSLVADCERNPARAYELNVLGSVRWFEAAALSGVRHFVFCSTSHVYGSPEFGKRVTTSHPTAPVNAYGRLKLEAETALREISLSYPHTKLTILRLFSVLSASQRPGFLFTNLHLRAQNRDFSPIPGLNYVRDFMTVDNVIPKLKTLVNWENAPDVVHICSGQGQTVRDIAKSVFAEYGLDASSISQAPPSPNDITWIVGEPTPGL